MFSLGGFEVGSWSDDAVEAHRVKRLVAVVKAKFGDKFGHFTDNPKVIIEAADIGAATGVEQGANGGGFGN